MGQVNISDNSRRVAKNTVFLYLRMLLLMLIGLFTSRVILKQLGADDYGLYNAVGGLVMIFTSITTSISTVISRFITVGLGEGDSSKLKRIFSTSVVLQLILFGLLLLLIETVGVWFLNTRMDIPDGRLAAANIVLQCSAGTLLFQMLSVPFNAVIIAHERMNAFALLSILEGVLKLLVAILIMASSADKLVFYAILMLAVSAIVRTSYATFCHRNFSETHAKLTFDRSLVKEMARFSGWNFLGASAQVFSPQGITLLTNIFFGVAMNAARAVASQVENIVKQFAQNIIVAINPQITKSYVSGDRNYSYSLVCKACKYSVIIILLFLIPLFFEADVILDLWLEDVPANAALFTRLTMIVLLLDLSCSAISTLVLAEGRIKWLYIAISLMHVLYFFAVWWLFNAGYPAYVAYIAIAVLYLPTDVVKILIATKECGIPRWQYTREVVVRVLPVILLGLIPSALICRFMADGMARLLLVLTVSTAAIAISTYAFAMTEGERSVIKSKLRRS